MEKLMFPSRAQDSLENDNRGFSGIPVDILDTPKEIFLYLDVPELSKLDIQVSVEDESTLVIKSGGKRRRGEVEEEGCKYIRLERKAPQKLMRLPENANVSAIAAKCENGVLTVVVEKLPPPPKPKTVEVLIVIPGGFVVLRRPSVRIFIGNVSGQTNLIMLRIRNCIGLANKTEYMLCAACHSNIPTITFSDFGIPVGYVDLSIPANNKGKPKHWLSLRLLTKLVLQLRRYMRW
ncbi:17.4 kDa class III heat shock protein [Hibiscus syriacus]|uniref:17.4 kDa class III heat shock protein n=1 Tax=Hibiscus syriacus TaxID=106335 RepID=A0A6A2ZAQ8_HIBSY|nr:17.4 kDa class III heat shock protein [Hibiscus syriacus]